MLSCYSIEMIIIPCQQVVIDVSLEHLFPTSIHYTKWRVNKWSNSEQALETDFEAKNGGFVGAATSKHNLPLTTRKQTGLPHKTYNSIFKDEVIFEVVLRPKHGT